MSVINNIAPCLSPGYPKYSEILEFAVSWIMHIYMYTCVYMSFYIYTVMVWW